LLGRGREAEEVALPPKAHVLSGGIVERDVKVGVPQVDGNRPIAWSEGVAVVFHHFHAEVWGVHVRRIQLFQVEDGAHAPTFFRMRKMGLM
jgi:hypothetical protein